MYFIFARMEAAMEVDPECNRPTWIRSDPFELLLGQNQPAFTKIDNKISF